DRQADQGTGGQVVAPVGAGEGLAVRGEDPGWRERLERPELVLASTDEPVIDLPRAHDVPELRERQEEDVVPLPQRAGPDQAVGLVQQSLLVDEVATDHAVLRMLPVPDEVPD